MFIINTNTVKHTHSVVSLNRRKLFEYYKKRSCVGNRTNTSALSEWMVE